MFGRSTPSASPTSFFDEDGGRTAAVTILPGMALPPGLVTAPALPTPADQQVAESFEGTMHDDRELVGASVGASAAGVASPAPAKRQSFSAFRRKPKAPAAEESFAEDLPPAPDDLSTLPPPTPAFAPTAADFALPDAPVADADVETVDAELVEDEAAPFDVTPVAPADPTPAPFVPTAAAPVAPAPYVPAAPVDAAPVDAAPVDAAPVVSEPVVAPPPYVVPPVADPTEAAPAVAEDPLFHQVPVHGEAAPVAGPFEAPVADATARRTFREIIRARLRPQPLEADAAWATGSEIPAYADGEAPVWSPLPEGVAPPPYAPPPAGAVPPAPFVPEAPAEAVPSFAHLTPMAPPPFAGPMEDMAGQVAAQVAAEHAAYDASVAAAQPPSAPPVQAVPAAPESTGPSVGLVFADGTHAELGEGPEGAALQHVAGVLAGENGPAVPNGDAAPNE